MWEGGCEKKDSFLARIAPSTDCPCQSCRSLQFTSVSSIFGLGPDCFVYSELAPVESNFWRALVQSCVRPYCLYKFSPLCGSGIVLSSSFYSLRLRRQFVIVGRNLVYIQPRNKRVDPGSACMHGDGSIKRMQSSK